MQHHQLVRRFKMRCLYVEVWQRAPPADPPDTIDVLTGNVADPRIDNLTLGGTMSFECAAHATGQGFRAGDVPQPYRWQLQLPNTVCFLPAGNEILANGPSVPICATVLLARCKYDDV